MEREAIKSRADRVLAEADEAARNGRQQLRWQRRRADVLDRMTRLWLTRAKEDEGLAQSYRRAEGILHRRAPR